jgi:phosphate transport system permease protein
MWNQPRVPSFAFVAGPETSEPADERGTDTIVRADESERASVPPTGTEAVRRHLEGASGAGRGDLFFRILTLGAGLMVLAILAMIVVSTAWQAWPAFQQQGISFITSNNWDPNTDQFGALAFIWGTLMSSGIALVMAVPVSVGIALFTTELAHRRLRGPIGFVIDLLAAVPSVVYGLWGVLVLAPNLEPVYGWISSTFGGIPVLSWFLAPPANGKSFMTAGMILAFMITPIITSLSREVIATVPRAQREAALALGATRWEMIRGAILPWSRGGITGAVMLGLGRAMGETIAAALVIGSSAQITTRIFANGDSMAAYIANQFGEANGVFRSALIGLGLVLFGVTIIVNILAQQIITRFDRRAAGT